MRTRHKAGGHTEARVSRGPRAALGQQAGAHPGRDGWFALLAARGAGATAAAEWRGTGRHRRCPRGLAPEDDVLGVAAERRDVVRHPLEGGALVLAPVCSSATGAQHSTATAADSRRQSPSCRLRAPTRAEGQQPTAPGAWQRPQQPTRARTHSCPSSWRGRATAGCPARGTRAPPDGLQQVTGMHNAAAAGGEWSAASGQRPAADGRPQAAGGRSSKRLGGAAASGAASPRSRRTVHGHDNGLLPRGGLRGVEVFGVVAAAPHACSARRAHTGGAALSDGVSFPAERARDGGERGGTPGCCEVQR